MLLERYIFFNLLQPLNAPLSIVVIPFSIIIFSNPMQLAKALYNMFPPVIVTVFNDDGM